jgi:hypothetical protein
MSCNPIHSKQTSVDGIHTPIAFVYANAAARNAATGFVSTDLNKFALDTDDNSIWMLVAISPITWIEISAVAEASMVVSASYVLTSATGSLPNAQAHELLKELIHLSDDDGPRGIQWPNNLVNDLGPVPFPTASIWWTDSSRTKKIVDAHVVRNPNKTPSTIQWKAYASDGVTVVESYTDTITYSGVFPTSRIRSQP